MDSNGFVKKLKKTGGNFVKLEEIPIFENRFQIWFTESALCRLDSVGEKLDVYVVPDYTQLQSISQSAQESQSFISESESDCTFELSKEFQTSLIEENLLSKLDLNEPKTLESNGHNITVGNADDQKDNSSCGKPISHIDNFNFRNRDFSLCVSKVSCFL